MSESDQTFSGILPLALAREIQDGLKEFLDTSFKPSTRGLEHLITDFTADRDNLFRGPYLGLDLPFTVASDTEEFFPDVPLGHRPYLHQQQAFERLQGSVCQSTLVSTGTGSGKTECFLLPILDWCLQHAGEPGIKAIVIYPMNALAEDQAKRLAAWIWDNPLLRGKVRAGMYADQEPENPALVMSQDDVIRSRARMHRQPPDILLTNYKMLDNLLIRPDRKRLWARNGPDTLRYLVVDELHTFDGAQGTDLACLIRRLKTRLQVPPQSLCCVGTSATLGQDSEAQAMIEYAQDLFDEEFGPDAVITENRIDLAEFLDRIQSATVLDSYPSPERARELSAAAHTLEPEALIRDLYAAWFDEKPPADTRGNAWRAQLGDRISRHVFLHHLLAALDGRTRSLEDLARRLRSLAMPARSLAAVTDLLEGFVTLVAYAKRHVGGDVYLPFLPVRAHFWIRELTRMVVSLPSRIPGDKTADDNARSGPASRLRHSRDLAAEDLKSVLPVVFCRECSGMAWIALETLQGDRFDPDLDTIYEAYFAPQPSSRLRYLVPHPPPAGIGSGVRYAMGYVCRQCLRWHTQPDPPAQCRACQSPDIFQAWRSPLRWKTHRTGRQTHTSAHCAYCHSSTGTGIFGVSGTSIASTLVSLLFAAKANGDPKLLAFGDSVQDVAHKAGFIEARSFRTLLRQTVAHWLSRQANGVTYARLQAKLADDTNRVYRNDNEFVGALTHVDLMWLHSLADLFEDETDAPPTHPEDGSALAINDQDLKAVKRRLEWETFSELTFRSQFGRTLENTGCLTLSLDPDALGRVARAMKREAGESLGTLFEEVEEKQFRHFLLGVLHRMLHDGAVRLDPDGIDPIYTLAQNKANWIAVLKSRSVGDAYPQYGRQARKPLLPSLHAQEDFAVLTDAGSSARWYPVWARKSLPGGEALRRDRLTDFYALTFDLLTQHGLTEKVEGTKQTSVWLIPADKIAVGTDTVPLACDACQRRVQVRQPQADLWRDMPCLNPSCAEGQLTTAAAADTAPVLREHLLHGRLRRVNARDHSGMLEAERRRRIEKQFIAGRHSWYPNLLSTTPTLELGVDIGDLSSVMLYAVPPSQANYVQRQGRAGRRDGNALGLTIVNAQPHDLYFWTDPLEMIQGAVATPGLYLEAYAILRRQFCAFALERLIIDTGLEKPFGTVRQARDAVKRQAADRFPLNWIEFVERRGPALLRDFAAIFGLTVQSDPVTRLEVFVQPAEQGETFRAAVLDCLRATETENAQWEVRIRQLDREIRILRDTHPAPKDREEQLRDLDRERRAYRAIRREVNGQDVLELLTDFGILPNYAFPEEGVKLRSVIVSRGDDRGWQRKAYDYVRPASSGLSEFAPGSHFYAEGHRVPIHEIDLRLTEPEAWRFCPICPYMEREADTPAAACPQCGAPGWRDLGQVHRMVRLKQVHAESTARQTRIVDDQDVRTITRYTREMYPAFDGQTAQGARLLAALPQPFGFEFLPRVEFRDVNFGRRAEESLMAAAGQGVLAAGFLLCERCGHALSPRRPTPKELPVGIGKKPPPEWKEEHARHCPVRREEDDAPHRIQTFLYHSFQSEAVRLRLPIRNADEVQIESFTAALHLGLRLAFQGRVDHLRSFMLSLGEGGARAHWLFLYDSVPGGTGHLEQLVQPEVFHEVLSLALRTMQECVCNQDQEQDAEQLRDGCYRCLLGYRHRARMPAISRDAAIRMIREILAAWPQLQEVASVEQVNPAQLEESELELRFVAWLEAKVREAGGQFRTAPVRQGKKGYVMRMDDVTWEMEPQVDLGPADGVAEPSRADFLLRQIRGPGALSRPLAVFMDGWAYHRDRMALDVRQRLAIRASGKFWIWSLTWDDVQTGTATARWDPFEALDTAGLPVPDDPTRELLHAVQRQGPAELLLRYLRTPVSRNWTVAAGLLSLHLLGRYHIQSEELLRRLDAVHPVASAYGDGLPLRSFFGLAERQTTFLAVGIAAVDLKPMNESGIRPFLYLQADPEDESQSRFQWAGALHIYNLFQFLPRTYWLCASDADPWPMPLDPPPAIDSRDAWEEAIQFMDASVRDAVAGLRRAGMSAPAVGWELERDGQVVAELELAWPKLRVGVLLTDLPDALGPQLAAEGWRLVHLDRLTNAAVDLMAILREAGET